MELLTTEQLLKALRYPDPNSSHWLNQAAATIERLEGLSTDLDLLAKKRLTLLEHVQQERDALKAEVERLKVEMDEACAIGGVDRCLGCGTKFVTEDKTYCMDCSL